MTEKPIINDFSILIGTVNGSGSQTANLTIMRALFKMGIPVSGKNIYPSNIQGMPTWYEIRVSKEGYSARVPTPHIVVAMCEESFQEDEQAVCPGGVLIYDEGIRQEPQREDITLYPIPVRKIVRDADVPGTLRTYVANMVYVGALAQLLGIKLDNLKEALQYHFSDKEKPVQINYGMVQRAADWLAENLEKEDPYRVEELDKTRDYQLASGNTAAAIGAIFGGIQFMSWYPITPATGVADALNNYLPVFRTDPDTGKNTFAVIQAEDELAAIGMAVGAGWGGLRSMTSTSGPGLSLMTEFVGLAYYSETPLVIWDVQRVGPSTGLPTRTSQGDLTMAYFLGHGDTKNVILLPASPNECFQFGWKAFDLAERLQAPVFVLSDLDLGVNQWMSKPFDYPDAPMDRGKVLWEEDLEAWEGKWGRYLDVDGDGIPYRTLPGNQHEKSAWFARGTGHDEYARYSEDPDEWHRNMERLNLKFETAREMVPHPEIEGDGDHQIGVIAYGSTDPAVREALDGLAEKGLKIDYMRIRAVPFSDQVGEFIHAHERIYVVELNRDGQMHQLLTLNLPGEALKLRSLARLDGMPLPARWVEKRIMEEEEKRHG